MSSQYAILESFDVFADVDSDAAGDSAVVSLNGADKFSCQLIYTVDSPVNASVTFQKSNDGVNWTDIQVATSIAADGTVILEVANVSYRWFKAVKALDSGTVNLQGLVLVIGDAA